MQTHTPLNRMTQKKLTLIVGAGASNELGLPLGPELKRQIASLLAIRFDYKQQSGDYNIAEAIRLHAQRQERAHQDINDYLKAARQIKDGMPQAISIDHFIDSRRGDEKIELCGKLAIVRSILQAEQHSKIYLNHSNRDNIDFNATETTWLNSFFQLLSENARMDDLENRLASIAFVIFNYDRCIEHYLFHALQNYYQMSETQASELLRNVIIYHPYGSVGDLPWQNRQSGVFYGEDLERDRLLSSAKGIRTFTEGTDPQSSEILAIRDTIIGSRDVLVLGFAFHRNNMQLLNGSGKQSPAPGTDAVFATAKGISDYDRDIIAREICAMRGCNREKVRIRNDLACYQIFHEYARGLSLTN